ncbi:MAG TPA: pyridoxamine 5'-phosphate oxidase family protein [Propionibacteriaceae bacterium]|nr:pyridoxamine 5'-phosphate oxidase family protein [Propionibacteriaceae bacterium]
MTTPTVEEIDKVSALIGGAKIALVTSVNSDGQLVSRPLAMQDREFDGTLWFFTADPSPKTEQVQDNDQVNVALQVDKGWVSIAGTATVSHDQAMIDELWTAQAAAWFEGGRDDPAVALLRVKADTAEYWTMESNKVVSAIKYAKAIVTGGQPDVGDNATIKL